MKLSQAIRIGSKIRPQCFGKAFALMADDETVGSCALGAALEGGDVIDKPLTSETAYQYARLVLQEWPDLDFETVPIPGESYSDSIVNGIETLNDKYKWTREKIADWLESLGY
jgi:hypothetical protein